MFSLIAASENLSCTYNLDMQHLPYSLVCFPFHHMLPVDVVCSRDIQEMQCTCNVTLRHVCVTITAMEKQDHTFLRARVCVCVFMLMGMHMHKHMSRIILSSPATPAP